MTQAVRQILDEIEQLSSSERVELRRAVAERVPMSDDLTDDDFATLAAEMFRRLDEEEFPAATEPPDHAAQALIENCKIE
jgi:hypothetical protein